MSDRRPRFLPGSGASVAPTPPPNPDVFTGTSAGNPGNTFFPTGSPFPGQQVWANYLTSAAGDRPLWILNDLTTLDFGLPNVAAVQADNLATTLKAWGGLAVPANAIGVRIAASAGSSAALLLWRMAAVAEANDGVQSNIAQPFTNNPSGRSQAYLIAGCIGVNPQTGVIPSSGIGLTIAGMTAVIGAVNNTPNVPYPVTYRCATGHTLGFYQAYTNSKPPIL